MEPFRPEPIYEEGTAGALGSGSRGVDLTRLGLTLSGGGFRATLFHLGVVRLLHDVGWLPSIKRIGAVSGGSILAAHLVLNWERYTGTDQTFDAAAQEILDFTRSDIRGRVVRRWLLAWLTLFPRLLKREHWTFTNLLQRFYARLYKDATLEDLLPKPGINRPQVFFYCTSLSTGSVCSFGRSGFMWDEEGIERNIVAPMTPVAFAVAASSAFPPLFPPIAVSHEVLYCDRKAFPNVQYLTDGGVYDNLGIDRLLWYHKQKNDLEGFLISDAEGNFDWDLSKKYTFITTRNIRASALLMKRVSRLEYDSLASHTSLLTVFDIDKEVQKPGDITVLPPEVQRILRNVRTDLDAFSSQEASLLICHGYTVAREVLIERGLLTGVVPEFSWQLQSHGAMSRPHQAYKIRRSRNRKLRLWSPRDWASWVSLLIVIAVLSALFIPAYLKQRRLSDRAALSEELKEVNQKLTNVAINFYKQRHRPVEPGISAGHVKATAGTICCIVKLRGGRPQRFLLGGTSFTPRGSAAGDLILQPSRSDGGHAPEDVVARLYRILPLDLLGSNSVIGAIAEISPGVEATNNISGLGPIRGVADSLSLGQEVFVAGRTTGIAKAVVSSLNRSLSIQLGESTLNFTNLVELKVGAGGITKGGDSGAPVLTSDGKLAGMAFAGSAEGSYAVPIQRLFDALGVELDMPRFRCLAGTISAQGGPGSIEARNAKCQASLAPDGSPPNGIPKFGLSYSWISDGIPCSCIVSM